MGFLSLLWRHRVTLMISAVLAAAVGLFFGLTGPVTWTSGGNLLLPSTDPVAAQGSASGSKPENSLVGIQVKSYADNNVGDDVRKALGHDAVQLSSFSSVRQRDTIFYKITAEADHGPVAAHAVQAGADAMIKKADALAKAQLERLQTLVTQRLAPLDQEAVTATADQAAKQSAVDTLETQVKSLQGQIDAASQAAARAVVSGKGSTAAGSSVASGAQAQLDALNKQLIPAQGALEQAKSKAAVINAERTGLQTQVQKATDSYLSAQVSSALAAPPDVPVSGRKLRLVTMVALEIIVSLAVAAASIAWLERRQLARVLSGRLRRGKRSGKRLGAPLPANMGRSHR